MRPARTPDTAIDRINSRTYRAPEVVRYYGSLSDWLDIGERTAVVFALTLDPTPPLLDIGVGGGRTVPLLRNISGTYTGIDYTPEMIARARVRFPDVDLRVMDARQLEFDDATFGLAVFSFNGLDSVGERGRATVLQEVWRVLRPGGVFVFSALNHCGAADRMLLVPPELGWRKQPHKLVRWSLRMVSTVINMQRSRGLFREESDASVRPVRAHAAGLVGRYTSLARECAELNRHGFEVQACFDPNGELADPDGDHAAFTHFHYVARKPF